MAIVVIAVCTMITFPLMMIPVGMRESTPAGVLVGRAYADAYPYDDQEGEATIEDWAIVPVGNQEIEPTVEPDDPDLLEPTIAPEPTKGPEKIIDPETGMELIILGEGEMVGASYIDDYEQQDKKYADVMTAQVVQTYDSSDLPIEMLDTSAFTPVEEELYIKTTNTLL